MMASPKLHILDVAHGSSAIIQADKVCVVDSPAKPQLQDKLRDLKIEEVDYAFVSHADSDHVAGITSILLDESVLVRQVFVNPDAMKGTDVWEDFRVAVATARKTAGLAVKTGVNSTDSAIELGQGVEITVVSPDPEQALAGSGGRDLDGKKIDANANSIVLRVIKDTHPRALLAGDMTIQTLSWIKKSKQDIRADYLVFPHHGGKQGTDDNAAATEDLLSCVAPSTVIFSNGRGKHDAPRQEIVEKIVQSKSCSIACTQISKRCAHLTADLPDTHVHEISAGKRSKSSCAGSITISLDLAENDNDFLAEHQAFVDANLSTALCRIREATQPPTTRPIED